MLCTRVQFREGTQHTSISTKYLLQGRKGKSDFFFKKCFFIIIFIHKAKDFLLFFFSCLLKRKNFKASKPKN